MPCFRHGHAWAGDLLGSLNLCSLGLPVRYLGSPVWPYPSDSAAGRHPAPPRRRDGWRIRAVAADLRDVGLGRLWCSWRSAKFASTGSELPDCAPAPFDDREPREGAAQRTASCAYWRSWCFSRPPWKASTSCQIVEDGARVPPERDGFKVTVSYLSPTSYRANICSSGKPSDQERPASGWRVLWSGSRQLVGVLPMANLPRRSTCQAGPAAARSQSILAKPRAAVWRQAMSIAASRVLSSMQPAHGHGRRMPDPCAGLARSDRLDVGQPSGLREQITARLSRTAFSKAMPAVRRTAIRQLTGTQKGEENEGQDPQFETSFHDCIRLPTECCRKRRGCRRVVRAWRTDG